jgi:hypothetical protein
VKVADPTLPASSLAVHVTVVMPNGKIEPDEGVDLPPVLVPFVKLDPRAYCPYLM